MGITEFIRKKLQQTDKTIYQIMKEENYSLFQLVYKINRRNDIDVCWNNAIKIVKILIANGVTTRAEFLEFCRGEVQE